MAGGLDWNAAAVVAVVGWMVSPVINFFVPKILSGLGFDASLKLQELEIHIIPELKKTLQAVDQERMMQRGKRVKTDLDALDKMGAMLRHALEDAEDIFDDAQEKIVLKCCHRLCCAFAACIVLCKSRCVWIARVVRTKSARLLQWVRKIISWSRWLLRRPEDALPVITSESSSGWWLSLCGSFDFFKKCGSSLYSWLAHVFEAACFYRDWSYQVVGIKKCQENASLVDIFLIAISRMKLKKRIQKVENTVSEVNKPPLLGAASNNTPNDIANKNRSRIRVASKRKVFGREVLRDDIMARLRETPQGDDASSRTTPCC